MCGEDLTASHFHQKSPAADAVKRNLHTCIVFAAAAAFLVLACFGVNAKSPNSRLFAALTSSSPSTASAGLIFPVSFGVPKTLDLSFRPWDRSLVARSTAQPHTVYIRASRSSPSQAQLFIIFVAALSGLLAAYFGFQRSGQPKPVPWTVMAAMAADGEEESMATQAKQALAPAPPAIAPNWALSKEHAAELVDFINRSPSPFHATEQCRQRLEQAGFRRVSEREPWAGKVQPGGKYYFTRNGSSIVAFAVGGRYQAGNGVKIIGAHSDSPNLQVKPNSATTKEGYQQVSVATYGGGLWHTWLDRDLSLAGRVIVRDEAGILKTCLVNIQRPVLKVPNLCIHLQSPTEREALKLKKEDHLRPILCTTIAAKLEGSPSLPKPEAEEEPRHHSTLLQLLATELGCALDQVVDFDLSVYDVQPASLGGLYNEFVFAPRIDNLASCHCALEALCNAPDLEQDPQCRAIALFDHEEVGSESYAGAGCTHLPTLITRLTAAFAPGEQRLDEVREATLANSFLLSADCAHAVHPNYADKHHPLHRPALHKGVVLKFNANQRYATTALTAAVVREVARRGNVPLQNFAVGNDTPCGSTIGPISATRLGVPTVDLGVAQLSMHSIRETCGAGDVFFLRRLFETFFSEGHKVRVADGE